MPNCASPESPARTGKGAMEAAATNCSDSSWPAPADQRRKNRRITVSSVNPNAPHFSPSITLYQKEGPRPKRRADWHRRSRVRGGGEKKARLSIISPTSQYESSVGHPSPSEPRLASPHWRWRWCWRWH
ncbi:hypothetical protein CSHISOI_08648 [Colletotrichum shisoi]|uniref:Uncharacterized protein n=1 Tax=Colletotrichum shisoi TaxID=2078593 RepID=A0A5Q4BJM6_9PEZI|nr:hypothetical protein CSHISOI_08648 [Colletotrichum shisoi]